MGIASVTEIGGTRAGRKNGRAPAFTGLRWTRGEWIVVRKAGKEVFGAGRQERIVQECCTIK